MSFWWLSLVGSVITSAYAIHLGSVPYILGVLPPTVIYARNLFLIAQGKKRLVEGPTVEVAGPAAGVAPPSPRTAAHAAAGGHPAAGGCVGGGGVWGGA